MQARRTAIACLAALILVAVAATAPAAARSTVVMCIGSQGELQAYIKPRACIFKVADKPPVGAYLYRLESLRWRHWGAKRATAKGRFTGNMQYRVRSTVTLSRRSPCGGDRRGYRRFAMTRAGQSAKIRIPLDRCPRAARAAQRNVRPSTRVDHGASSGVRWPTNPASAPSAWSARAFAAPAKNAILGANIWERWLAGRD